MGLINHQLRTVVEENMKIRGAMLGNIVGN
jgi:hypothetical protein